MVEGCCGENGREVLSKENSQLSSEGQKKIQPIKMWKKKQGGRTSAKALGRMPLTRQSNKKESIASRVQSGGPSEG